MLEEGNDVLRVGLIFLSGWPKRDPSRFCDNPLHGGVAPAFRLLGADAVSVLLNYMSRGLADVGAGLVG